MGLYCEFFHHADDNQIGFDPEFPRKNNAKDALRLRVRNLNNHLHFRIAEAGISPTHFQADTFPPPSVTISTSCMMPSTQVYW